MMRIRPLDIPDWDKCMEVLNPPKEFYETSQKTLWWKLQLPLRLEKANELIWKKFPIRKLQKIDDAIGNMRDLAERSGNLIMADYLNEIIDFAETLPLLFKNYEEMVCYTAGLYHILEQENVFESIQKLQSENLKIEDKTEKKYIKRVEALERENSRLKGAMDKAAKDNLSINAYKKMEYSIKNRSAMYYPFDPGKEQRGEGFYYKRGELFSKLRMNTDLLEAMKEKFVEPEEYKKEEDVQAEDKADENIVEETEEPTTD